MVDGGDTALSRIRRVATPEGSRLFKEPIGAPILGHPHARGRLEAPVAGGLTPAFQAQAVSMKAAYDKGHTVAETYSEGMSALSVQRVILSDGTVAILKNLRGEYEVHDEVLAAKVANVLGISGTQAIDVSEANAPLPSGSWSVAHRVLMSFGDGKSALETAKAQEGKDYGPGFEADIKQLALGKNSKEMAVLDYLIHNIDRHVGNWLIADDGHIIPIDHGLTFGDIDSDGDICRHNPFIAHWLRPRPEYQGNGEYHARQLLQPTGYTSAELDRYEAGLKTLEPDFDAVRYHEEYAAMMLRMNIIKDDAILTTHQTARVRDILASVGVPRVKPSLRLINPRRVGLTRHVRTPEGAKLFKLPIGSPIQGHLRTVPPGLSPGFRSQALSMKAAFEKGYVPVETYSEGATALSVQKVRLSNGSFAILKNVRSAEEVRNEVLAAKVAHALDIADVQAVDVSGMNYTSHTGAFASGKTVTSMSRSFGCRVLMSFGDGIPGTEAVNVHFGRDKHRIFGTASALAEYFTTAKNGKQIALLDFVTHNLDRNNNNWLVANDGHLIPIDHGLTFRLGDRPRAIPAFNQFILHWMRPISVDNSPYVNGKQKTMRPNYSVQELARSAAALTSLKPDFQAADAHAEYAEMMERMQIVQDDTANTSETVALTRHVRTPEGVKLYKLPIGAPIISHPYLKLPEGAHYATEESLAEGRLKARNARWAASKIDFMLPPSVAPGKYHVKGNRSTGKAHMLVFADGTGMYVSSKGVTSPLTAKKIQSNFAAGMSHQPDPAFIPVKNGVSTPAVPAVPSLAPVVAGPPDFRYELAKDTAQHALGTRVILRRSGSDSGKTGTVTAVRHMVTGSYLHTVTLDDGGEISVGHGQAEKITTPAASSPTVVPDSIAPGEYHVKGNRAIGKAHIVVEADGTGSYVGANGASSPLTVKQVKARYKAGMNYDPHKGVNSVTAAPVAAAKAKKASPAVDRKAVAFDAGHTAGYDYATLPAVQGTKNPDEAAAEASADWADQDNADQVMDGFYDGIRAYEQDNAPVVPAVITPPVVPTPAVFTPGVTVVTDKRTYTQQELDAFPVGTKLTKISAINGQHLVYIKQSEKWSSHSAHAYGPNQPGDTYFFSSQLTDREFDLIKIPAPAVVDETGRPPLPAKWATHNFDKATQKAVAEAYRRFDYDKLNMWAREGNFEQRGDDVAWLRALDQAIDESGSTTKANQTVYRGMSLTRDLEAQLKVGAVMTDNGYLSTSRKKKGVDYYAESDPGRTSAIFTITLPSGLSYIDMNKFTGDRIDDDEWLFGRGSQIRITKVTQRRGVYSVEATMEDPWHPTVAAPAANIPAVTSAVVVAPPERDSAVELRARAKEARAAARTFIAKGAHNVAGIYQQQADGWDARAEALEKSATPSVRPPDRPVAPQTVIPVPAPRTSAVSAPPVSTAPQVSTAGVSFARKFHGEVHSGTSNKFYESSVIAHPDGSADHVIRYGSTVRGGAHETYHHYTDKADAIEAHEKKVADKSEHGPYSHMASTTMDAQAHLAVVRAKGPAEYKNITEAVTAPTLAKAAKPASAPPFPATPAAGDKAIVKAKLPDQSKLPAPVILAPTNAKSAARKFLPMQYAEVDASEIPKYERDPNWYFQQKVDGMRGSLVIEPGKLPWMKKKNGDQIASSTATKTSDPMIAALIKTGAGTPATGPSYIVDGEILAGKFYVFDFVIMGKEKMPWHERMDLAEQWVKTVNAAGVMHPVALPTARTQSEKENLHRATLENGQEGLVIKHKNAPYTQSNLTGSTRGVNIVKAKYISTADVVVTARNVGVSKTTGGDKENALFSMWDEATKKFVPAGGVSMHGKERFGPVKVGDVIEVRYLFSQNGNLVQAAMTGVRRDKTPKETSTLQVRRVSKEVLDKAVMQAHGKTVLISDIADDGSKPNPKA